MANGTCSLPECDSKVRARGLCVTHYNQQHQPNRHAKVEVACGYCGEPCMKAAGTKYQARFCSLICRDVWRMETGTNPYRHYDPAWDRSVRKDVAILRAIRRWKQRLLTAVRSPRPPRPARVARAARVVQTRQCPECDRSFETTLERKVYCSGYCHTRAGKMRRQVREGLLGSYRWAEVIRLFLIFDRCCAYCEQPIDGQPQPDHVVPLSRGGSNSITNILPCCAICNSDKRDLALDDWNADRVRRYMPMVTTTWAVDDRRVRHLTSLTQGAYRAQRASISDIA